MNKLSLRFVTSLVVSPSVVLLLALLVAPPLPALTLVPGDSAIYRFDFSDDQVQPPYGWYHLTLPDFDYQIQLDPPAAAYGRISYLLYSDPFDLPGSTYASGLSTGTGTTPHTPTDISGDIDPAEVSTLSRSTTSRSSTQPQVT